MRSPKQEPSRGSIGHATDNARRLVKSLRAEFATLDRDKDRVTRMQRHWCKACHYVVGRYGGQVMCSRECGICGEDVDSGNTATLPVLCLECGKKNRLCCRCGGDIDMINRQKPRPFEADEST